MDISLKKIFFCVVLTIVAISYTVEHYSLQDVLKYAKKTADPNWTPRVEYYVGMAYYAKGRGEESAGAFEQLLADYPTGYYSPDAMYRLGVVYTDLRRWEEARTTYQKYLEVFPEGPHKKKVEDRYEIIKFR